MVVGVEKLGHVQCLGAWHSTGQGEVQVVAGQVLQNTGRMLSASSCAKCSGHLNANCVCCQCEACSYVLGHMQLGSCQIRTHATSNAGESWVLNRDVVLVLPHCMQDCYFQQSMQMLHHVMPSGTAATGGQKVERSYREAGRGKTKVEDEIQDLVVQGAIQTHEGNTCTCHTKLNVQHKGLPTRHSSMVSFIRNIRMHKYALMLCNCTSTSHNISLETKKCAENWITSGMHTTWWKFTCISLQGPCQPLSLIVDCQELLQRDLLLPVAATLGNDISHCTGETYCMQLPQ